jgi:hypothetical protein
MKLVILNFHGVGDPSPGTDSAERMYWWDQTAFESLLDQICRAMHEDGLRITITFDDGNMSDAHIALPALSRRGLTARFFVCAGRIGQAHYLDKAALADLLGCGHEHRQPRNASCRLAPREWSGAGAGDSRRRSADARGRLRLPCIDEAAVPFGSYDRRVIGKLRRQELEQACIRQMEDMRWPGFVAQATKQLCREACASTSVLSSTSVDARGVQGFGQLIRKVSSVYKRMR